MKAHAYINEHPDNFFGFQPDHMGSLKLVTTFQMPDDRDDPTASRRSSPWATVRTLSLTCSGTTWAYGPSRSATLL